MRAVGVLLALTLVLMLAGCQQAAVPPGTEGFVQFCHTHPHQGDCP